MKVAIIGSHSVGKTTLLNELNKHLNLPVITEVARRFPRDITDDSVKEMKRQINILDEQLFEEMQYDEFLSDRSTLDNCAYIFWALKKYHKDLTIDYSSYVHNRTIEARQHAEDKYDHLFYIPIEFACVDDGFRNTDENERTFIDRRVNKMWMEAMGSRTRPIYKPEYRITGNVKERVNKILEVLK